MEVAIGLPIAFFSIWFIIPEDIRRLVLLSFTDQGEKVSENEMDYTMNVLSKIASKNMELDELFKCDIKQPEENKGEVKEMDLDPNITTPNYFEKKYGDTKIDPQEQKQKILG